ncbi:FolC protein [Spizellomyces punctatus DAOM BR117]|uniref:Dihydrofolate synthetase n=1 Tax=Spizellomyces punctatus (strain DAOM BR117) TaxID=645134 RepID=A0A0L0HK23_SPIPD|nr:FolC protein [Spizellomyces punctatus DAOM BR117]KND01811.1 FolC protein [Spizellomyces punctatus DAOM BR117]|eukprot:XP_016609850.1 FolC protein [Spizellomyces punctatus DAOM BR117]
MVPTSIELGLDRINRLLAALDSPQTKFPVIHVAGTNGKGSVTACISAILTHAGYRTGRFNSPHLVSPLDVIRINDRIIAKDLYATCYGKAFRADEENAIGASLFEIQTATAFLVFAEQHVDIAILEVGLGGRLDATNVCCSPLVCVFTAIGMDHVDLLGDTIEKIAAEKGGIIKPGAMVVIGPQVEEEVTPVLIRMAAAHNCPVHIASPAVRPSDSDLIEVQYNGQIVRTPLALLGAFQLSNAATALKAIDVLTSAHPQFKVPIDAITSGMSTVRWAGRLEWVDIPGLGRILIDGAHNPPAAEALADFVSNQRSKTKDGRVGWIVGLTQGKDLEGLLSYLLKEGDSLYAVPFSQPEQMPWIRCIPADSIRERVVNSFSGVHCLSFPSLSQCLNALGQDETRPNLLVLCGSLYLVADLYRLYSIPS